VAEAPVVVVGAGMAGTAAAWAASREKKRVVLLSDRAGASSLYAGLLDFEPAETSHSRAGRDGAGDALLGAFVAALGVLRLGREHVATSSGVVRATLGADRALLDLTPLAGKRVALADVGRDDWDAPLIARTLSASSWAERTRTTFLSVAVKALRAGHERRIPPYDFALLHDDELRQRSLADALKHASEGVDAWLTGPWLGVAPDTATVLRRLVPLPLGETTSPLGGPAGARFESARDRLLASQAVELVRGRLTAVRALGGRWLVELTDDDGKADEIEARSVVLATGGVAAGGLLFTMDPGRPARGFVLPFEAPVVVSLDGDVQGGGGSLYGPSLETVGLGALERAGIHADWSGRPRGLGSEENGLLVAGDAVAGRPRTMLEAAVAGLAAGTVAARV